MTLKKGRVSRRRKYWYDQSPLKDLSKSTDTDSNEKQKNENEGTHSGKDQEAELQSLVLPQRDTIEDDHNCSMFNRRNDDLESSDCQENTSQPATSVFNLFNEDYKNAVNELVKSKFDTVYAVNRNSEKMQIFELYPSEDSVSVMLNVTIDKNFRTKIFVHKVQIMDDHDFWIGLPNTFADIKDVERLLSKLQMYTVCIGNTDVEYETLLPSETAILTTTSGLTGYREGNMGAVKGDLQYTFSIRNTKCNLLVQGARCSQCSCLRRVLRERIARRIEKERELSNASQEPNFLSTGYKHSSMTKDQLIGKINQQKSRIVLLQHEVLKIQRKFDNELRNRGVDIDELQSLELKDTMAACTQEMEKAFPNSNSFQRLFWMQRFKSLSVKSNKGMRWHPMILRWCLYLRQKSNAAYESLRDSGFITLPSNRLFALYKKC